MESRREVWRWGSRLRSRSGVGVNEGSKFGGLLRSEVRRKAENAQDERFKLYGVVFA